MGKLSVKTDKRQAGFTLVELAVVMIIIGLLIGGVLKGQELITNAQVTSAVSQMKGIDAAVTTFRDTYAAVPGDMNNAQARLPDCSGATNCTNGDGNNRIDTDIAGNAPTAAGENVQVWRHLTAGDLINGVDNTGNLVFGEGIPEASIGGGYFLGFYTAAAALPGTTVTGRAGHYLALTGDPTANVGGANSDALRASQVARIDRKMDDGAPTTGTVISASNAGTCFIASGGTNIYNEATDPQACSIYVRIQQ